MDKQHTHFESHTFYSKWFNVNVQLIVQHTCGDMYFVDCAWFRCHATIDSTIDVDSNDQLYLTFVLRVFVLQSTLCVE